jgi:predicted HicB family RNase H-like nuclease
MPARVYKSEPLTRYLVLRLTKSQHDAIHKAAHNAKISASTMIRERVCSDKRVRPFLPEGQQQVRRK